MRSNTLFPALLALAFGPGLASAQAPAVAPSDSTVAARQVAIAAPSDAANDLDDWVGPSQSAPDGMAAEDFGPGDPGFGPGDPDAMDPGMDPRHGGGPDRGGWGSGRQWGHRGPGRDGGMMLSRLVNNPELREKLGISAEQAAKIRQQTLAYQTTAIRNRADVQVKRLELRDLMAADNPDRAAIDRKLAEVSAAQLTAEKASVGFRLDMRNALTADQKAKLEQWRKDMMQKRWQDRGDRGPGNRGPRNMRQGPPPDSNRPPAPGNNSNPGE